MKDNPVRYMQNERIFIFMSVCIYSLDKPGFMKRLCEFKQPVTLLS